MKIKIVLSVIFLPLILAACVKNAPASAVNLIKINDQTVKLEIAATPEARAKGLSNHEKLKEDEGMLFVFPDKAVRTFWMKEMKFDLDIIWIADDKIVKIDKNLPAEGGFPTKLYSSIAPVNYVLEVNAGWSEANRAKAGDSVKFFIHDSNQ